MDVVSNTTVCCIFKSDTRLKNSSLFSVKCLDMNVFLFYSHFKMWEKETEKCLMMKLLKHDIQIYWQEAVLISFLPVFYMLPLDFSLFIYLILYFHPIYTALPHLFSYIVLALIFLSQPCISISFFSSMYSVFLFMFLLFLYYWLPISIYIVRLFSIF